METDRLLLCRLTSEYIIFYESRIGHSVSAHILVLGIKVTSICREFCLRIRDSRPVSNDDATILIWNHFFFFQERFAKWRKATLNSVMSVLPNGTTRLPLEWSFFFMKCDIWIFFENLSRKLKFDKKSGKNNGYFTWRSYVNLWWCLVEFFLEWEIFQFSTVEKIETHFAFNNFFFFFENPAAYVIM